MIQSGWRRYRLDLIVFVGYVAFAAAVSAGLWHDPATRALADNATDQTLFEWFLAHDTRLAAGHLSLVTDRLNAPDGVNLLANTSVIVPGLLLTPLTLLTDAATTFAALLALNLAGTAAAWYLLFSRTLGARRSAAALGGAFCGFAPGMISQSNAHLHMTAQWLVPLMVWLVVRLARAADRTEERPRPDWRRVATSAAALAVVVTIQVFVGEEVLFLTALTMLLFCVGYAVRRPAYARRVLPAFLTGLAITAGVAGTALAYPLWMQFAGPQSVSSGPFPPQYYSADLAGYVTLSPLSLLARLAPTAADPLGSGPTELNTFLGWPLVSAAIAGTVWLWRRPIVTACAGAAVAMLGLSLGPTVLIGQEKTSISGPYRLLEGLPVVDGALPTRFALALVPLIATILVLAVDQALRAEDRSVRLLVPAGVLVALLPAVPAPLAVDPRPPVPRFIADGHWRSCVQPGGVLVPVPLPTPQEPWAMRWAAAANASFGIPQGFFIAPYGADGGPSVGVYSQPTADLLAKVGEGAQAPGPVSVEERDQARKDVAHWGASCVAMATDTPNADALRLTLEGLFGPATQVADAWTWRVG